MTKRRALAGTCLLATLLLWWGFSGPSDELLVPGGERATAATPSTHASPPHAPRSRVHPSTVDGQAPPAAASEPPAPYTPTPWSFTNAALAAATLGSNVGPWQSKHVAVETLCDVPAGASAGELESWIDTVTWHPDVRGTWAAARRASGPRRLEFLDALTDSEGITDCGLSDRLRDDLASGRELPIVPPTRGTPALLEKADARWLARLRTANDTD